MGDAFMILAMGDTSVPYPCFYDMEMGYGIHNFCIEMGNGEIDMGDRFIKCGEYCEGVWGI